MKMFAILFLSHVIADLLLDKGIKADTLRTTLAEVKENFSVGNFVKSLSAYESFLSQL